MPVSRRFVLVAGVAAAALTAGCVGGTFHTAYAAPIPADVSRQWKLAGVRVNVPQSLKVSEAHTYLPAADIVWREDPLGDRHAQVAALLKNAVTRGASGLRGKRGVYLDIVVSRFHALTFEAEQRFQNAGVHNIHFTASVVDARTGEVLVAPTEIEASLPALSGDQMKAARARGETQRSQITAHVATTIAGWLSLAADPRNSFSRAGD
ncbi:DUF6778 family protein [Pseudogemmobacter blasticus]|uniref:DUF3313 domain-containing protein n=1 Tax=Fuscovulum blasticum DSM 2131 TaxID=1188250 RepID=A0A2T4J5E7_FUSBL|nr:DUF6778 family protein [Fuscovulum blasticum]AWD20659.1 hypothetical protein B6K69_02475 [Fuscovulum blasticum]PTE13124.1 hypothetical protein C5F44_15010 [Fuscovulum blasticum DSM 2131]